MSMVSIIGQSNYLDSSELKKNWITYEEYEQFQRQYVIDALKGLRYGQSFCNYFNIPNGTPLFYFRDHNRCEEWIKQNYLVKK